MLKSILNVTILLPSVIGLMFLWHCSEYNPTSGQQGSGLRLPTISDLLAPAVIFNMSTIKYSISVRTQDPQGLEDITGVNFTITKDGANSALFSGQMLDDASAGDILPKDGVFTTQIQGSLFSGDTGEFILEVTALDSEGNVSNTLTASIFVLTGAGNTPPEIKSTSSPSQVVVDSTVYEFLVTAEVNDADGADDLDFVVSEFYPPAHATPTQVDTLMDDGQFGDLVAEDGIYSMRFSSQLFTEAADHFLRIVAHDVSGAASQAVVLPIRGILRIQNPPEISNLVAPDTVQINPSQAVQILITIDVFDPQGLSDIDFVRFRSFLPNGSEAQNSPIELADDGNTQVTGDTTAGDGTYSIIINLPPTGVTPGDFRFVFQARDKSGLESNIIEHIMTVIE